MVNSVLLGAAFACSFCGMAWLALAMRAHWRQIRGETPLLPRAARSLRVAGAAALMAALLLCLQADHASVAVLVWIMGLSASMLLVAFTLAWRAYWLAWLAAWVRGERSRAE